MTEIDQKTPDQTILDLVTEACKHPPGSPRRQKNLTQVIRLVSKKLWRENTPYYEDALHQTWLYFCKYICPNGPKIGEKDLKGQPYDSSQASVATWLNKHLKYRLRDEYIKRQKEIQSTANPQVGDDGKVIDPLDTVPGKNYVEPLWEKVKAWAEEDATGELSQLHIEGHPKVTCQVLILRRLLSETSWKEISQEFGVSVPTLSSFYRRQCMPRLRNFGECDGYVDNE